MKLPNLRYYAELYRAYRVSRRFYKTYQHLTRDVAFYPEMNVRLDVYSQPSGAGYPVLLFVHGGRWRDFHKEMFAGVAKKLLPEGMVVVIPDHTLYPHASYEQMTHEVAAALSWTLKNAAQHGGDPGHVVVAGHSSGGHLVELAVLDGHFMNAYGHTGNELCGVIGMSGAYDLPALYAYEQRKNDREMTETIAGVAGSEENLSIASPISHVAPGCPPTLLLHGNADETVPVEQATAFHTALLEAGARSELIVYPGRGHSEILFSAMDEERPQVVVDMAAFVHGCSPAGQTQ